jgi:hypothetical protein
VFSRRVDLSNPAPEEYRSERGAHAGVNGQDQNEELRDRQCHGQFVSGDATWTPRCPRWLLTMKPDRTPGI